ncbi:MAG: hypothetical protein ABIZ04_09815 [Opitutus sp.]
MNVLSLQPSCVASSVSRNPRPRGGSPRDPLAAREHRARFGGIRTLLLWLAGVSVACGATSGASDPKTARASDGGDRAHIVIDAQGTSATVPLFFSASVDHRVQLTSSEITGEWTLKLQVIQGRPELLSIGLTGEGQVIDVSGKGLRDWAVRQGTEANASRRFLDLRPLVTEGAAAPRELELTVHTRLRKPPLPRSSLILLATPGDAVGFTSRITVRSDSSVDYRVTSADGLIAIGDSSDVHAPRQFATNGLAKLEVSLLRRGTAVAPAELLNAELSGTIDQTSGSAGFHLRGQLRASAAGARLRLLSGRAALNRQTAGDGWHIELSQAENELGYELVADRAGSFGVELDFAAAITEKGDWRQIDFHMPAGAVVPLRLDGFPDLVEFDAAREVVPTPSAHGVQGFLPASGAATLAWKSAQKSGEGSLAFTSAEQTEVRVGAGLLRQESRITFRVLQGKLASARLLLDGPGEILGVTGTNVVGWNVIPGAAKDSRILELKLSRPFDGEGSCVVRSQSTFEGFPVRAQALRLTPEGTVRHSGFVRVANNGAVRLELADTTGMMQLAPNQFPGTAVETGARQVFVYRFPSASYTYSIVAHQIQSEVNVAEVVTYELTDTDRVINADLELDIREAPLRDWSFKIPADYSVVAIGGADVVDHAAESDITDGYRSLKILFGRPVEGRQLLKIRLEKNQAAAAGDWTLPRLLFPGAKTVRGYLGAVSTPGYRMVPGATNQLAELPLSFFPRQTPGLQQAWRVRAVDWLASVKVEALGQSVQADVFHLYSLKEGVVYGSVLLNYFVVGAPASEWRIEVPESVGNIDVTGQNVRRDWRREGNQVIVTLHQPVLGAATLLITFEQPMSARGGTLHPGELRPLGVQSERGFLQVVSPLQVKHKITHANGGLLKLEALELPTEFRLLSASPSLAVYQYTARPFALEMAVEWYPQAETVDQVVDFAKLSSQVSREGQVVTDARFFVKTRGRKALRLVLPPGMKLWEARVNAELVTARTDGEQTLVPLPAQLNANNPVEVALRLGQSAATSPSHLTLVAPKFSVPVIIDEWTLRGDAERLLVPEGGNAELVRPALTENGFEWMGGSQRNAVGALFGLILLGALLLRTQSSWLSVAGIVVSAVAAILAVALALQAFSQRRMYAGELEYAATIMPTSEALVVHVANLPMWRAMISWTGLGAIIAGVVCLVAARRRAPVLALVGAVALSGGILAQRLGAVPFLIVVFGVVILRLLIPGIINLIRQRRSADESTASTGDGAGAVISALAVLCTLGLGFGSAPRTHAESPSPVFLADADSPASAQSIIQRWAIRENRVFAELDVTLRGRAGDTFLLLKTPAVLTEFRAEGARITKVESGATTQYSVVLERDGSVTGHAKFEMKMANTLSALALPTGPAALQEIAIDFDQPGWDFFSPQSVKTVPATHPDHHSRAVLTLAPGGNPTIELRPKQRDVTVEATRFFVEAATLYIPGPGVVNGYARVTVRPAQGRVSELELDVPTGFTVGDVSNGPVGSWRFDPEKRRLRVAVQPAQSTAFRFNLEMQRGAGALPMELGLEPLRVLGAAEDVGTLAVAFGNDAQPEAVRAGALPAVAIEDFDSSLIPRGTDGEPLAVVQHVWRYARDGGRVDLKVAPVAPEVRVAVKELLTLDDDRLLVALDLKATITRVGLFRLSFVLPAGLEIEALSGPALNHWTESSEQGERVVTLHLNGRTMGEQPFYVTLAGAAPHAQEAWSVPRILVREATRQTGELVIVPGKGLRLRAGERQNATQLDPREAGGVQPGTLAFRLLQADWAVRVGIESLEPWVTTMALQEVTVREGQTLTRIALRLRIDNAAMKQIRLRLPGLSDDQVRTVHATGSAISDFVPVAGQPNEWEAHFQRGIVGETDLQIEFQGAATQNESRFALATPVFINSRQATLFVALRSAGRLEIEAADLPRGWQRVDWTVIPANLQNPSDRSVPALCFRVAEPEGPLTVNVRRHDAAEALKLRVTHGELATLFSPAGASLTAVNLAVDVLDKSTLRVRLPVGAKLFNTFVNGESVAVVREGDDFLFHVSPLSSGEHTASVRLVYSAAAAKPGQVALVAPSLSVPLENVAWRVILPPGYRLHDYSGALRLREERSASSFGIEQYQALVVSTHAIEAKKATALFEQATALVQRGDQQMASEVLSRAAKNSALDQASNEDARVQLKELKTQQAVLGLATRRQRLYLDNRGDGARNEQLEQAATLNPFMQGKANFNPREVDQLLMGNSVEETSALRGIAGRIVDQQLAAEPAPSAIDLTLPERGQVLTFTRSLQVDGAAPLHLTLEIAKLHDTRLLFMLLVMAAITLVAALTMPRRLPIAG